MAHSTWPLTLDFWLVSNGRAPKPSYPHLSRVNSQGARGPWSSLWAPSGHPKPPKRTPKPTHGAPKSPKGAQMSPTGRPAPKIHEKSSPKHGPEQRRTMKYDVIP